MMCNYFMFKRNRTSKLYPVSIKTLNGVKWGYIDDKGDIIIKPQYEYARDFEENGLAVVEINGKSGAINESNKFAIMPKYESITGFSEGLAVVIDRNGFKVVNERGQELTNKAYSYIGSYSEGRAVFNDTNPEGKYLYGYLDEQGQEIILLQYGSAGNFNNGKAVVGIRENQYGLIDEKGNFIIKPEYNDVNVLGEGMVAVGKAIDTERPYIGSNYAIADTNGKFLTEFIYNNVSNYKDGLASASDDKNTFFIDRTGNRVKNLPILSGSGTVSIDGNLIKASIDFRVSYFNKAGKIIWKQNTIIPLSDKYMVVEEKFKPNVNYLIYYPQIQGMDNKNAEQGVNNKLKELSQIKDIGSNEKLDYNYTGDFLVEFFRKNLSVLELNGYEYHFGAAHGMPTKNYPHIKPCEWKVL